MKQTIRTWDRFLALPVKKKWHFVALYVVLFFAACLQCSRLEQPAKRPEKAIDFRNIYIGSLLVSRAQNPYSDENIKRTWKEIQEKEHISDNIAPGLPQMVLVYPPFMLFSCMVLVGLKYGLAVAVFRWFLILQTGIMAWLIFLWLRQKGVPIGILPLWLLIMAAKPTVNAINVGQPSLFVMNILFAGLLYVGQKKGFWKLHFAYFFGLLKPNIGFVLGIFYLKNIRFFLIAVVIVLVAFSGYLVLPNGSFSEFLVQSKGIENAYNPANPDFPFTFDAMANTHFSSVMALFGITGMLALGMKCLLLAVCVFLFLRWNRQLWKSADHMMFLAICGSLVFTYHKYYELLLLLPFALLVFWRNTGWERIITILFLAHLMFPYKSLLVFGVPESAVNVLQFANAFIPLFWLLGYLIRPRRLADFNNEISGQQMAAS